MNQVEIAAECGNSNVSTTHTHIHTPEDPEPRTLTLAVPPTLHRLLPLSSSSSSFKHKPPQNPTHTIHIIIITYTLGWVMNSNKFSDGAHRLHIVQQVCPLSVFSFVLCFVSGFCLPSFFASSNTQTHTCSDKIATSKHRAA